MNKNQRSCDGGGGAQRPVLFVNELKKTGARSAHAAHARPKPTSLSYIYLGSSVCHPVCRPVIFLSYSCHIPVVLS